MPAAALVNLHRGVPFLSGFFIAAGRMPPDTIASAAAPCQIDRSCILGTTVESDLQRDDVKQGRNARRCVASGPAAGGWCIGSWAMLRVLSGP